MAHLDGKIAIITGAGGGIGRATAILLASEGATIVAADIDLAAATATVRQSMMVAVRRLRTQLT